MFMSITKQVLRYKKDTKEQLTRNNDVLYLQKGPSKGVKRKCC